MEISHAIYLSTSHIGTDISGCSLSSSVSASYRVSKFRFGKFDGLVSSKHGVRVFEDYLKELVVPNDLILSREPISHQWFIIFRERKMT